MATLKEFFQTGQLGPIGLGLTPFEVQERLGDPDDESKKKNPLILRYGNVELCFWRTSK